MANRRLILISGIAAGKLTTYTKIYNGAASVLNSVASAPVAVSQAMMASWAATIKTNLQASDSLIVPGTTLAVGWGWDSVANTGTIVIDVVSTAHHYSLSMQDGTPYEGVELLAELAQPSPFDVRAAQSTALSAALQSRA